KASNEKQNQLAEAQGTLAQLIQHSEEKCKELEKANEEQKQKEAKLYERLHGVLPEVTIPFTHSQLSNYSLQLEDMLEQNQQDAEQLKKELWRSEEHTSELQSREK